MDALGDFRFGRQPRSALNVWRDPRLEPVIQILVATTWDDAALERLGSGTIGTGARILGLAQEFDGLLGRGYPAAQAMQMLQAHAPRYGEELLGKFTTHIGTLSAEGAVTVVPAGEVEVDMILMQDVFASNGTLLAARGYKVTQAFRERIANFGSAALEQSVHVMRSTTAAADTV
jgi:hypothetical protein